MHYYKSAELAKLYNVSRRTVTNWVKQTQEGKLDLELAEENGESYIIKSSLNQAQLDRIVSERQKYLNHRSRKYISPKQEFYEIYNDQQILDIIQNLTLYKELPLQYTYFSRGAEIWNNFRSRPEGRFDTNDLIEGSVSYLNTALKDFDKVNVIDIGVGNGMAAYGILAHLKESGKLNKYIGIDISKDMLATATKNIQDWFSNEVPVEGHVRDISHQLFGDIIAEPIDPQAETQRTINVVLLFGGSISNFKDPGDILRIISRSMGSEDLFMCHFKLATEAVKNRLSFIEYYQKQSEYLLDLMGIDESFYEREIGTDETKRFGRIRLNRTVKIDFILPKGRWSVNIKKNETILTYRATLNDQFKTPRHLFNDNGLNPLLVTKTLNNAGMLILANLKTEDL